MQSFVKMMPNLVHLTIPLDRNTFHIVCKNFCRLRMLNVLAAKCRYVELDDVTTTGVSKDEGCCCWSEQWKPNITNLTLLTDLSIACEEESQGHATLTDHSVIHGFLHLTRLHSLSVVFKELIEDNRRKLESHVKGHLNIQVKDMRNPEYYCDLEIDNGSPSLVDIL